MAAHGHITYTVRLEQYATGVTQTGGPFTTLPEAYTWLGSYGVFDPKDQMWGHVYSDGSAVIGKWTIHRIYS